MCTYILLWSIVPHHLNLPSPQPVVITGKVTLTAEQPCNKKQPPTNSGQK